MRLGVGRQWAWPRAVLPCGRAFASQGAPAPPAAGDERAAHSSTKSPRRPRTEADQLVRDIEDLGRRGRTAAHGRGRLSVPAGELALPRAPEAPAGDDRSSAAREAFTRSKVRPSAPPPRPSPGAAVTKEVRAPWLSALSPLLHPAATDAATLPITDVAFTLDEMERTLFSATPEEHAGASAVDGGAPVASRADTPPLVTADDDVLCGRPEPSAAQAATSSPPPSSPEATTISPTAWGDDGRPAATPASPQVAKAAARWVSDVLPSCLVAHADTPPSLMLPPVAIDGLLSVHWDPHARAYVVAASAPIPSVEHLVAALSDALTRLEARHAAARAPVTTVMLHFSSVTTMGHVAGHHTLLPVEGEAVLSALARLRLAERKEALLHRLSTSPSRGLRVTAVVGGGGAPLTDVAAELLLCCPDVYTIGALDALVMGFPSLTVGVLLCPSSLHALRGRVEHVLADGRQREKLLAALGTTAETPVEVLAEVARRLHTTSAATWASLGLWEPAPALSTRWWTRALARLRDRCAPFAAPRASPTPLAAYCAVACEAAGPTVSEGAEGARVRGRAWREALLKTMDTPGCTHAAALVRHARATLSARVQLEEPHHLVHVTRASAPPSLSATALREALGGSVGGGPSPHVTVVLDADLPLADRERLLAELQASLGVSGEGFSVALVGEPAALGACLSTTPLAAVLTPVGTGAVRRMPLRPREVAPPTAGLLAGVFEISLAPACAAAVGKAAGSITPSDVDADAGEDGQVPMAAVYAQAGAVQFLQWAGQPFIFTSTGDEGARTVAVLAHALCRAHRAAPAVPVPALLAAVARRLRPTRPLSETLRAQPVADLQRRVAALDQADARAAGDGAAVVKAQGLTQLLHLLSAEREAVVRGAAVAGPANDPVEEAAEAVVLGVLDAMLTALLHGRLAGARDGNLLSTAALSLAPTTGGLLGWADDEARRRGMDDLVIRMEMVTGLTGYVFPSLQFVRWMQAHGVGFAQLEEATLRRARAELRG